MNPEKMINKLDQIHTLARASKWKRLFSKPLKYIPAIFFKEIIYPKYRQEKEVVCPLFYGKMMKVALPASTDIYLMGGKSHDSEIRLAKYLILNLKPDSKFLDIGAHYGYFTLLASELVGANGKVLSFEPTRKTFSLLKENAAHLEQVDVYNQAVSDSEKSIIFHEFPNLYSEYNSSDISQFEKENWFQQSQPQQVEIPAVSMDYIAHDLNFLPDIIKIDVEGAEEDVIRGGLTYLNKHNPQLIMEYLIKNRQNTSHQNALDLMLDKGFRAHVITASGELQFVADVDAYLISRQLESDNIVFLR